ncbi:serine/threonine-protein kinase [Pseudoduganella sp. SL102]|uniref:serine/threonine protein kinase n=1 Tax=Pseudoduganella sp. SL102 TaxID=2995154 RepID=UPI00248D1188|nr:serine/threonine-protein kinase [Pseudoduganella sp. SL102]WBS00580.1 serine/threonine-protein kinase [Pseudoduganella sp. SL102]
MNEDRDGDRTIMPAAVPLVILESANNALPSGTRLAEFEIAGLIGQGGFGIVYQAYDHSLQRTVALKEYMPSALAAHAGTAQVTLKSPRHADTFQAGLRSFVNEARLLAAFDHPALVKVYRFWEDNGTAYMVMPLYRGATLKQVLRDRAAPPDEAWLRALLAPLLDALELLHQEQCYHRDIAPDNILILDDGRPLLLDFGAARRAIAGKVDAFTVILKRDYAPVEQYADIPSMTQGPWTDLYALASVVYLAITGKPPMPAVSRMIDDPHVPLGRAAAGRYSPQLLDAIDHALAVKPEDRPQSVAELRALLGLSSGNGEGSRRGKPAPAPAWHRLRLGGLVLAGAAAIGLGTSLLADRDGPVMPAPQPEAERAPPAATPSPTASAPADPASAVPAAPQPFDPVRALDEVFEARNRDHAVTISIERAQVRIGVDPLRFAIRSSRPGYVYLLMVGTDRTQFWLLFPNSLDADNRIAAGSELALPRATWRMTAAGPPGTNQFVAIVSDRPRDFRGAGLKVLTPFSEFDLGTASNGARVPGTASPLFAGTARCDGVPAAQCSPSYGAAVFSIAEVAP